MGERVTVEKRDQPNFGWTIRIDDEARAEAYDEAIAQRIAKLLEADLTREDSENHRDLDDEDYYTCPGC